MVIPLQDHSLVYTGSTFGHFCIAFPCQKLNDCHLVGLINVTLADEGGYRPLSDPFLSRTSGKVIFAVKLALLDGYSMLVDGF